jgi:hypothetical protein
MSKVTSTDTQKTGERLERNECKTTSPTRDAFSFFDTFLNVCTCKFQMTTVFSLQMKALTPHLCFILQLSLIRFYGLFQTKILLKLNLFKHLVQLRGWENRRSQCSYLHSITEHRKMQTCPCLDWASCPGSHSSCCYGKRLCVFFSLVNVPERYCNCPETIIA